MYTLQHIPSGAESFQYRDFVAFTSTFYKDDIEGKIRSEAFFSLLDNAQKMGVQVVVGDGGSGREFLERVKSYSNVKLIPSGKGGENTDLTMGGERRYTGQKAMEFFPSAKYFLWLEPEKTGLMSEGNIDAILAPMRSGDADMVVPSRKSKDTLPPQQRGAESRANKRAMDIVKHGKMQSTVMFKSSYRSSYHGDANSIAMDKGVYSDDNEYDLWFGPKAFTRESMEQQFLSYKGAKWDGIITSVVKGILDGQKVISAPVDFSYPSDQTLLESDPKQARKYQEKRRSQYRYVLKTISKLVRTELEARV